MKLNGGYLGTLANREKLEHRAWLRIVDELKKCAASIDINEERRLTAAIELWGERLADLRVQQTPTFRQDCLDEAMDRWTAAESR